MPEVLKVSEYNPRPNESYFFDANVWMYLFCPLGNYSKRKQKEYSNFLSEVRIRNSGLFINSLVLSEFSNAYLRLEFDLWRQKPENTGHDNYKRDFVGSDQFKAGVTDIKILIGKILAFVDRSGDNFNAINIQKVFGDFGNCDFNDAYYLALAQMNKHIIVTDDADFFNSNKLGIKILTANI